MVNPVIFRAENQSFPLIPTGMDGKLAYLNGRRPLHIDAPQRFGGGVYQRIDPGQSTLRLDLPVLTLGISTANQIWGPASRYPLILGDNAPGFPHLFLGTSAPLNLGVGSLAMRIVLGQLSESPFSPAAPGNAKRLTSGYVWSFAPRAPKGLEFGLTRFFHAEWPKGGPSITDFPNPFLPFFKTNLPESDVGIDDRSDIGNQLLSVFGRWIFVPSGLEVFAEFAREDHSWNLRDFLLEPDHNSAYEIGFRKFWLQSPNAALALHAESVNGRLSHLAAVRAQAPFYVHTSLVQGHTQLGQILGSPAAFGGAATTLALDVYRPFGRLSVSWERAAREAQAAFTIVPLPNPEDNITRTLGLDGFLMRGRFDIHTGIFGAWERNHNFNSEKLFNLNLKLTVTGRI
jgi:hypothetical protein